MAIVITVNPASLTYTPPTVVGPVSTMGGTPSGGGVTQPNPLGGVTAAPASPITPLIGPTLSITPGGQTLPPGSPLNPPTQPNTPPPPLPFTPPPSPVKNLIVESPIQRGDNFKPFSRGALIRSLPEEANPYRQLPQEILNTMGDLTRIAEFYKTERPLDLLRQKGDKFWNRFTFEGFYLNQQEESDNLPFSIQYDLPDQTYQGSIKDVFRGTPAIANRHVNTNFMGTYKKENLVLNANRNVLEIQQGASTVSPNTRLPNSVIPSTGPSGLLSTGRLGGTGSPFGGGGGLGGSGGSYP